MEKVCILGTGSVGATLGRRLLEAGYPVVFGCRNGPRDKAKSLLECHGNRCQVMSIADAAAQAETIILATPWPVSQQVLAIAGSLAGKTLVDCTNPLNDRFDGLTLGFDASAAETIAQWVPDAHVVKAFNTVSVATMENPMYDQQRATLFYCGDSAEAKQTVAELINAVGLEPIDAGPLKNARYLEPLAMLYIHLAVHQRMGGNTALRMVRR